jgi:hypothetical protein
MSRESYSVIVISTDRESRGRIQRLYSHQSLGTYTQDEGSSWSWEDMDETELAVDEGLLHPRRGLGVRRRRAEAVSLGSSKVERLLLSIAPEKVSAPGHVSPPSIVTK